MKKQYFYFLFVIFVSIWAACQPENEQNTQLNLPPIFSNNMVLQQGKSLPVWGIAQAGAKIEVSFRKQQVSTIANEQGKWELKLNPETTGIKDSLVVQNGKLTRIFRNVAVGEVWICSGQSNMEMNLACNWATVNNSEAEVAAANYPNVRLFVVERANSFSPLDTINNLNGWQVCTPATAGNFSAVAYFFGRNLQQKLQVPVGLIQAAWGGTVAEAWTSAETLKLMHDFAGEVAQIEQLALHKDSVELIYQREYEKWLKETAEADPGINGTDTIFAAPEFDDTQWIPFTVPGMWESTSFGIFDGTLWFRLHISLTAEQAANLHTLHIAPPDDADETWVNGYKVGASTEWDVVRNYAVPKGILHEGDNVVVVRLIDTGGDGGFMGKADDFAFEGDNNARVVLPTKWLAHKGYDLLSITIKPQKPSEPNRPTVLYNGMLAPLMPYAIQGAIWYQGESNTGRAWQYRELFPGMISDWRMHWKQGDFPFFFVQLANFMPAQPEPSDHPWAELREAQAQALQLPNTGMVTAYDIGNPADIHPGNKQEVGRRLSLLARNQVYSDTVACYGPMFESFTIKGNEIIVSFNYSYSGLKTSDNKAPSGFAICGANRKFYWANARIEGNKVIVSSPKVPKPEAVRYGWSNNPDINLYNSANLPAFPFRTDNYKLTTQP